MLSKSPRKSLETNSKMKDFIVLVEDSLLGWRAPLLRRNKSMGVLSKMCHRKANNDAKSTDVVEQQL